MSDAGEPDAESLSVRPVFEVLPIQQVDVYTAVREQLTQLIENGNFARGDRLPGERALAESLGVSRMVVREALRVLEWTGKVEIVQGAGTFVRNPHQDPVAAHLAGNTTFDDEFLHHLIDTRVAIEQRIVELAAAQATDADIKTLAGVNADLGAGMEPQAEYGTLDVTFEIALAAVAANPLLTSLQSSIHQLWIEAWSARGKAPGSKRGLHREHESIVKAIARGDATSARRIMTRHVDRYHDQLPPPADGVTTAPEAAGGSLA